MNTDPLSNHSNQPQPGVLLDLRQVVKVYNGQGGEVTALRGIDLQVTAGEFLVITGKSGSGKTTLVNLITGLDRLTSGEIWASGMPLHRLNPDRAAKWRGKAVGVVFQSFELLPTLSVVRNVMLPMDFAWRFSNGEQRQRALSLLEQVEILEHAEKVPAALSGGQQQRVAIARAMANDPPILVADEPTGSLDSVTARAVVDLFAGLAHQGRTIVLVTHDQDIAQRGSRTITLADGEIINDERRQVTYA